ncbi:MAG: LysR family transcriptional regulator [Planctomycetes bacterium]|nr:LysR family transcriptional regulator [Planctomycetota bacterium]
MSINNYRIFAAVVELKSFVEAANRLFLTPSAISHSITKLEESLGLTLFHRTRAGTVLTDDGKMVLPAIMEVLNAEERLYQTVGDIKGVERGTVGVATFDSVCINYIPKIVRTFRALHANINIGVYQGGYDDVVGWLRSGYADMGFISSIVPHDDMDTIPLFEERMVCLTGRDFEPANGKSITAQDVRSQNIIYQQNGYDAEAEVILRRFGVAEPSRYAVASDQANIALVESGLGICFMPELVLRQIPHNAAVYPTKPAFTRSVVLATMKNRPLSSAHEAMRDHIVSFFADIA